MVGDDAAVDVGGAQALGMRGALVKTGKYLPTAAARAGVVPAFTFDTFADCADWIIAQYPR